MMVDIKLLLLGNGRVGKTQIARWLSGKCFDPAWNSTHGIQIGSALLPGDSPARLQIWDFGGQDIYHGTHALFLRSPAVLMPVWDEGTERLDTYEHGGLSFRNHPLGYWTDIVRHQGHADSPVLIVQSKCDRPEQEVMPFSIGDEVLRTFRYRKQLHVSAKENRGRLALEEALRDAVNWLRDPARFGQAQIGAGWLRVQRRLEALRDDDTMLPCDQRRHRLMEQREFAAICAEEGGVTSPQHLLEYLDANGTVFHRAGLFDDRIVLDQSWALDAIYAVFDRERSLKEIRRADGRFTRAQLGRLVWQEHSDAEQKLFISMMQSCGICFMHRRFDDDDAEYIAPDLLPKRDSIAASLPGRWDADCPGEMAVFRYALLHSGLIRAIIAQVGEAAGPDVLYWQSGLCGFETATGSRFLIEQEMTGRWQGQIRVRTQRGQAAVLLDRFARMVEQAQAQLGMRPVAVERPAPAVDTGEEPQMKFGQEKSAMPEWYVSYAWGEDRTPDGRARERIVDDLCAAAVERNLRIQRDKEVLGFGDSISRFMKRIGAGKRVFVILSDKYLHSPHCMFELSEIWRTSKQEGEGFLQRVRIYALPDAKIWSPVDRIDLAIYWKDQYEALDSRVREHGATILGEHDHRLLCQMQNFYIQVSKILAIVSDIVQPRTFEELTRYGFDDLPG
jgi:internalin A